METITRLYGRIESRILKVLRDGCIHHRTKKSSGLWLGPLVGLCAIATFLHEDNSYSEICLLTGISGVGLLISYCCLISRLASDNASGTDFHVLYFLPSIITSTLYLLIANKGLMVSVAWGLSVGTLGTWGVTQTIFLFPGCFTIGEAMAVAHGTILFLLSVFTNLSLRYHLPPIHDGDIATVILQVGILYVASLCFLCAKFPMLQKTTYFYTTFTSLLFFVTIPIWHILLDRSPLLWLFSYIFSSWQRVFLIFYWYLCFLFAFGALAYQISSNHCANSTRRKTFHVLAVLVYVPGLVLEPVLLYLASGIVLAFFVLLELLRILQIPPLGQFLQHGFSAFVDEKDTLISLSPIYLLCGLSFPLWMPTGNMELLVLLSGVLTVGVGDTFASFAGSLWGKHKWSGSEKSVEGMIACAISQIAIVLILAVFGHVSHWILVKSVFAIVGVSMVESLTEQVDNLALPFLMYLCLLV